MRGPRIRVVLVGVEGAINLGMVARLCKNFGAEELYLVNPVAEIGEEALSFAAKGAEILRRARIVGSVEEAVEGAELAACTSSIVTDKSDPLRQPVELSEFAEIASARESVAIVFGRESTGLTRRELAPCNLYLHIAASPDYPVLNLSHAVGIVLYTLYRRSGARSSLDVVERPSRDDYRIAMEYVRRASELVMNDERQRISAVKSLEAILHKASPTRAEISFFTLLMRRLLKLAEKRAQSIDP